MARLNVDIPSTVVPCADEGCEEVLVVRITVRDSVILIQGDDKEINPRSFISYQQGVDRVGLQLFCEDHDDYSNTDTFERIDDEDINFFIGDSVASL